MPPPRGNPEAPLQMLVANLDASDYLGRIAIGRIFNGTVKLNDPIAVLKHDGEAKDTKVTKLFAFDGLKRVEIEQAAIDACERELNHLRRYRRVFNGVATIGPLLGLLGTVFGLIRAFNDVAGAGAMGRPDLLARGFGEALITTAMGLLVAIPAMVLHWVFTSRVDRLAMRLDETCQQVIDEISQESLSEPRPAAAARRRAG